MEQITTEKEIQQVLTNLQGVKAQLSVLLALGQKARVKLMMDFTADCTECGLQSTTVKESRDLFYKSLNNLTDFQGAIDKLYTAIDPATKNNPLNKDWPPKDVTQEEIDSINTGK